ncbi:hypothetical protein CSW98_01405 [Vibrio sp. HA2012]|uniref:DUF6475 domain-containing protein n=1 Tax=Vibrio sp. HA2012 TaxID=1971595 RepID=UPI000C2C7965|nr:DUF6475 domain-containing protein [Vibrio sp. HA2012]PJC87811.1 hypothetical protein CSW98_01405 [Vibrio sp. HA2012]
MTNDQKQSFAQVLSDTLSLYRFELTPSLLEIWWEDLSHFDLEAVRQALSMHRRNPDNGQFAPKPADVVRLLGGTSKDRAIIAWNKVNKAISSVGAYNSVVFDDPLIHAIVNDMGGWSGVCMGDKEELSFRQKEFENRYRTYLFNPPMSYPKVLAGISEIQNVATGFDVDPPLAVGNREGCKLVYRGGEEQNQPLKIMSNKSNVVSISSAINAR